MFVFLSYAHEDADLAERVRTTLATAGFDCFLDRTSLPAGQEYNARIGQAIARADLFIFLLSPAALEPGAYTLTELAFAEKKWRNPAGYVLPVASAPLDLGNLPAYLRPINVLQPHGNVEAEILAWVEERSEHGGGGAGEPTPQERLTRWVRQHQPPIRRQRRVVGRGLILIVAGIAFLGFVTLGSNFDAPRGLAPPGFQEMQAVITIVPMLVGGGLIIVALTQLIRGFVGARPIAALVLDRTEHKEVIVHLLLANNTRKAFTAVGREATSSYPGEIGWAFVTGRLLIGFERGRPR